jgi:DNA-binding transcriptional ArsR family regulator
MKEVLKALAEPRRLAILKVVGARELAAGEIAGRFKTTRPAISQHLRVLKKAGLLTERREGTRRLYKLRPETVEGLRTFLDNFWDDALSELKRQAELETRSRRGRTDCQDHPHRRAS